MKKKQEGDIIVFEEKLIDKNLDMKISQGSINVSNHEILSKKLDESIFEEESGYIENTENNEYFLTTKNKVNKNKKELVNKSKNKDKEINNKRGPSTPLGGGNQQPNLIRRRLIIENSVKKDFKDFKFFDSGLKNEVLDVFFHKWILKKEIKEYQEMIQFMSLERKYFLESYNNETKNNYDNKT